jgi:hypothetical protein
MRSALLETVFFYRDNMPVEEERRREAFLVAFAAVLVLIDAARFLREQFHHRHTIRAKLNEAEPRFGIPSRVYETVQASLTNPRHVWHLYHAVQYWKLNQADLRELASQPLFGALLAICDRLEHRLRATAEQLAVARMRYRTRQLWNAVTADLVLRAIYGLQKAAGLIISERYVRPGHRPGLPLAVVGQLRELLAPGDVLITRKEHALTNYFLPGFWPHAALFLGTSQHLVELGLESHPAVVPRWGRLAAGDGDEPRRVLEAMKDGVLIRSLRSPTSVDAVAVLRPQLGKEEIAEALARGLAHEGKSYDFDFDFTRSDRLVCTEVVYRAYEGIGALRFQLSRRAGRQTLSAEDLIQMALDRAGFAPLAAFCPDHGSELCVGQAAEAVLRQTHQGRAGL